MGSWEMFFLEHERKIHVSIGLRWHTYIAIENMGILELCEEAKHWCLLGLKM